MKREDLLNSLRANNKFDLIIIGSGATGLGAAHDAVHRGLKVLVVDKSDIAKVTSSKSTKLIHGGLRYLAQGNVKLVRKALKERSFLYKHAAHIVHDKSFVIPCYSWLSVPFYFAGTLIYDLLAGFPKNQQSKILSKTQTIKDIPFVKQEKLKAAVEYHDGAFDDTRMAISLALGIIKEGGLVINYLEVINFIKENDQIVGVKLNDTLSGESLEAYAPCVINATGVFVDDIRKLDTGNDTVNMVKPSQGTHLILSNSKKYNIKKAMLIPKTSDGRILFVVPWYDNFILGTTDIPMEEHSMDAVAQQEEVDFIIETTNQYFLTKIDLQDITAVYAGQRPLINADPSQKSTKKLSRDEKIVISDNGLITVAGGKWTTFREMGENILNFAQEHNKVERHDCVTLNTYLYGHTSKKEILDLPMQLRVYGENYLQLKETEGFNDILHHNLPYSKAHVIYAVKYELAQTLEDVLSRRLRCLFINAPATLEIAETVANIMAEYLNYDSKWISSQLLDFSLHAKSYMSLGYVSNS